jgi:RND superfamily putative drug exporter
MDAVEEDTSKIDLVTVGLVLLLVGMYFRSAITPWVPLMTIGMAFLTSTAFIYVLGTHFLNIHYSVLTIMLTVMLGAGTDYCIFIMSRYREERVMGRPKEEAVRTSLMWAGESIATSGAAVMIGFGALMIGEYTLVRSMGMALVIAVAMALLFALTMLPSLLMLIGDRVFWPNTMAQETERYRKLQARGGGYFSKSAKFSLKNRHAIVLVAVIVAVPAAYLAFSLESSYDFIAGLPEAESKLGLEALGSGFGAGKISPTYIVIQFEEQVVFDGALDPAVSLELESYSQRVEGIDNVRSVSGPTRPFGAPVNDSYMENMSADDMVAYMMAVDGSLGDDNRSILLTVVLRDEPFTTTSIRTIDEIRAVGPEGDLFPSGTLVLVAGGTAGMADVSRSVNQDFITMRYVVLVGIYLVLMVVLGSLLIPLRLIMTVLLNVTWTIAATMVVFEFIRGVPVLWMMPMILFVIAMGLGMDYDIFLTTRIREEVAKGKSDEKAIMTAVERTGGIITACGLVMAGAFGSMMLSSTALLQEFGFGLSFVILIDAMLVRIYLVPAIMLMLQKWNWYAPGRLQRVGREQKARKH